MNNYTIDINGKNYKLENPVWELFLMISKQRDHYQEQIKELHKKIGEIIDNFPSDTPNVNNSCKN